MENDNLIRTCTCYDNVDALYVLIKTTLYHICQAFFFRFAFYDSHVSVFSCRVCVIEFSGR